MAFHSAKETLTRGEVLDILRRNVKLYKNEPEFVNYIVDLALFLLENVAQEEGAAGREEINRILAGGNIQVEQSQLPRSNPKDTPPPAPSTPLPPSLPAAPPKSGQAPPLQPDSRLPRVQVDKGGKTRVYKVFRAQTHTIESLHCPICGSETRGERICPNCGNVL